MIQEGGKYEDKLSSLLKTVDCEDELGVNINEYLFGLLTITGISIYCNVLITFINVLIQHLQIVPSFCMQ